MQGENLGIFDIHRNTPSLSYRERIDLYKKVGFTHLGFYFDNAYINEGEDCKELYNYAAQIGLRIQQVHLDYAKSNDLSLDNESGEAYFDYLIEKVSECKERHIPYIIVHASKGDDAPLINQIGLDRVSRINELLKGSNTYLCFENVRVNYNLKLIFNMNLSNIKMCYDSGHGHCYGDEQTLLTSYADKILATHLHNNYGKDTHNLMGEGSIDWNMVFGLLEKTGRTVDYLEVFPPYGTELNKKELEIFLKKAKKEYFYYKNQ